MLKPRLAVELPDAVVYPRFPDDGVYQFLTVIDPWFKVPVAVNVTFSGAIKGAVVRLAQFVAAPLKKNNTPLPTGIV